MISFGRGSSLLRVNALVAPVLCSSSTVSGMSWKKSLIAEEGGVKGELDGFWARVFGFHFFLIVQFNHGSYYNIFINHLCF